MKLKTIACILCIIASTTNYALSGDTKLWYDSPAVEWTGGLPIGNGRLLGMVQGGIDHEVIQLNEETIWTGRPISRENPDALEALPEVRRLMFEGKYAEAEQLVIEKMLGLRIGFGMHTYQTLGDLQLDFKYPEGSEQVSGYRRELDLDEAIVRVSYRVGDATYTREVFSSYPDQAIIIHLSCDKPGQLSLDAGLSRHLGKIEIMGPDRIAMHGIATPKGRQGGWRGVKYEAQLQATAGNGEITASEKGIRVRDADKVTLKLVAASDYRGELPRSLCEQRLDAMQGKSIEEIRSTHLEDYRELFRRVELNLGTSSAHDATPGAGTDLASALPTDRRMKAFSEGAEDPGLVALYFQFGRYLLISSSRPGSLAINLWGKWIHGYTPDYNGDYHININIQMNYWPAEICNLSECHEPFIDLLDSLRTRGRVTARNTYGSRGFTAHHATDVWYFTDAIGNPPFGMWPMAPAWSAQHLWEHYLFGLDREYLAERTYPIMKEAAEFFLDYLVEHPKTGYMVTGPSTSPENRFITPSGKTVSLSMAPTMDNQLLNDLFGNCIEASRILCVDEEFRKELEYLKGRLMPMQIGEDGRLLEWSEPFEEQNKGHRHISHLWGLCPANQITLEGTPNLFEAARKSLDVRVENGAAASIEYQGIKAWVTNCYTRLGDGEETWKHLNEILGESSWANLFAVSFRGRDRKMLETDVNFGMTTAIAEMLIQSHEGFIRLLPALPGALPDGSVKGLRARGGFEVSLSWTAGKLDMVTVKSLHGNPCKLKYGDELIEFDSKAGREYKFKASKFK